MICPSCGSEFQPHVVNCLDCGTALITPDEHAKRLEEKQDVKRRVAAGALEDPVAIREGSAAWLEEMRSALLESGVTSRVIADAACKQGCSGHTFRLAVSRQDAERAHLRIEEYFAEKHPEARASLEWGSQGKCPACGSAVAPEEAECPDCGLAILGAE